MSAAASDAAKASSRLPFIIGVQVAVRGATFFLNVLAARFVRPDEYGFINVELMLFLSTVQFLSREGAAAVILLSWATVAAVALLSAAYFAAMFRPLLGFLDDLGSTVCSNEAVKLRGVGLFAAAALLESFAEPALNTLQASMVVSARAGSEGAGAVARTLTVFFLLRRGVCTIDVFGIGQISIVRHILTEGERIVMAVLRPLSEGAMGAYGLAFHLGSMAARLLFLPVEEAAFAVFAREGRQRGSLGSLAHFSRVALLLALALCGFGAPNASTAIEILYGEAWRDSQAGATLAAYCLLLPLLAFNGVTEGYVHAVASARELRWQSVALVAVSAVFVASAYALGTRYGAVGLVAANAIGMLCRIAYNVSVIYRGNGARRFALWRRCFPRRTTLVFLLCSSVTMAMLRDRVFSLYTGLVPFSPLGMKISAGQLGQSGVAGVLAVAFLGILWVFERSSLRAVKRD